MSRLPPVTLLTDFDDFYVAAMRGVIASHTDAPAHDIYHEVPPQDVRAAAFILRNVAPYYPDGTVHCVVVDPGVGTERRSLVVEAAVSFLSDPTTAFWFRRRAFSRATVTTTIRTTIRTATATTNRVSTTRPTRTPSRTHSTGATSSLRRRRASRRTAWMLSLASASNP